MGKNELRKLGWAAYGVAFLLVMLPLLDTFLDVWPLRVGEVTWRFGAVGMFSRITVTPLLGLLVAMVTSVYLEHRVATRVFSIFAFVGAFLALTAIGFFSLDAIQTRARVREEAAAAFDTAAIVAMVKYVAGLVVAVLLGLGGWKASGKRSGRQRARTESSRDESPRVIMRDEASEASEEASGS